MCELCDSYQDPDDIETECEECGASICIPSYRAPVCLACEYGEYNREAAARAEDPEP